VSVHGREAPVHTVRRTFGPSLLLSRGFAARQSARRVGTGARSAPDILVVTRLAGGCLCFFTMGFFQSWRSVLAVQYGCVLIILYGMCRGRG